MFSSRLREAFVITDRGEMGLLSSGLGAKWGGGGEGRKETGTVSGWGVLL